MKLTTDELYVIGTNLANEAEKYDESDAVRETLMEASKEIFWAYNLLVERSQKTE